MNTKPEMALGLDMAKAKFDACLLRPDGSVQNQSFSNDPAGYTRLTAWLQPFCDGPLWVALEATGSYSLPAAIFLHEQGHTVSLLNPARPKAFAQARGCRNKTDRIDARTLAEFVLAQRPEPWKPASPALATLQALVRRREDLLVTIQGETVRLQGVSGIVAQSIGRVKKALVAELEKIESALEDHVQSDPQLKQQRQLLCTMKGVREITAAKILAELGDPNRFAHPRQAGAFAGLTPRLHQSGKNQSRAGHLCKIGSPLLRKALYLPAITAMRHNPLFKCFAEKLRKAGKPQKVIIAAVMRKMLVVATALLQSGKPFNPEHCRA